ncbi:MAG: glycosyltransferase family 4 protein [Lachnospiraceae bacterium]
MKRKIALINQRYGLEVNGGSETLCRQFAEKLLAFYDVEVITTCALEYTTWDNYYPEGIEIINGVTVRRFKTLKSREQKRFQRISNKVFSAKKNTVREELEWIDEQGPYCPQFLEYIQNHSKEYDAVIYTTYLYYLTARGIVNTPNEQVYLIPTGHDELPIYLNYYKSVYHAAKGYIFLTEEEKEFTDDFFGFTYKAAIIAGAGVDVPEGELPDIRSTLGFEEPYILYAGRIDVAKGCGVLFEYFKKYKEATGSNLKLVLVGKAVINIPRHPDIVYLGFVEEAVKFAAMKESKLLVLASEFESLSIVVLESMKMGRPVLVNGKCKVLKGHCEKSNAGMYFTNEQEFITNLNTMLTDELIYNTMMENAKTYIDQNYSWDVILNNITNLLESGWNEETMDNNKINIQEVMETLKKEIVETDYQYKVLDFKNVSVDTDITKPEEVFELSKMLKYVHNVNKTCNINSNAPFQRAPGFVGWVKYMIKRVIRKVSRFYIEPIIEEQRQFNAHTVKALNQMASYIAEQESHEE